MDYIFIDTSIFESNNFLESKRIKEIYKLAEEDAIKVVMPKLIYDEISNRINKKIDESIDKFNKSKKETRIFRNIPSLNDKFNPLEGEQLKKELKGIIEERFKKSNFIFIDYPTLNIEEIFKNYFESTFPFGSGNKKNEFPDAFALKSIELWAEKEQHTVIIFSNDGDMLKYKSDHLVIEPNFANYLSNKIKKLESNKHENRLNKIDDIIRSQSKAVIEEIKKWLKDQLDDYSKYYDYSNSFEVHDFTIKEINVKIDRYEITSITEENISVQLKTSINYKVEIIIDDEEYMIKDYDTKEWVFYETKPVLVDEIRYIDVDLIFKIGKNDTVLNPIIESVNNDNNLNV